MYGVVASQPAYARPIHGYTVETSIDSTYANAATYADWKTMLAILGKLPAGTAALQTIIYQAVTLPLVGASPGASGTIRQAID